MEKGEHLTHKEICYRIFNGPIDKKLQAMQAQAKKTKAPVADILDLSSEFRIAQAELIQFVCKYRAIKFTTDILDDLDGLLKREVQEILSHKMNTYHFTYTPLLLNDHHHYSLVMEGALR